MYEMTIRLQSGSGICLYEQIYDYIKKEISDGKLQEGERLPSTRSLAENLQVARSTVDYAYAQLQDEGYIEARPYKGYFVCTMEEFARMDTGVGKRRGAAEVALKPRTEAAEYLYDFSPHEIDMTGFPFGIWKKITKNILTDANSELFARGEPQGDYRLRETIGRYLHSSRGVNCDPEQIIVGAGNDYLLLLLEKLLGRDVCVAMENPTYFRSYQIFQSFFYRVITVERDDSGMKTEPLEREGVNAVYAMPSHQFPSGTIMPIGRRLELLRWADRKPDRYIIEDDYDSEFRYHGKPIPALQANDEHGSVIYLGSFSKAIAPAIRISFMVLPKPLLEKYQRELAFYSCTVSRIDQSILNEFIREGYFERHLNRMRKIYRAKHELLLEELRPFRTRFRITGENAGLHLVLTAKGKNLSETELVKAAAAAGVRVYGMSEGMEGGENHGPREAAAVLLGFGALSHEQIREGVARLREVWLR